MDTDIDRKTSNLQRQKLTGIWKVKIFDNAVQDKTDPQLKDLIIENVEDEYINKLKKEYIGYKTKITKTLLAHIKQEWLKSITHERTKVLATHHAPWYQVTNITNYERTLTKAQGKCVDLGILCNASGKVKIYVEHMYATDVLEEKEFTTWEAKTEADKKMANEIKQFDNIYKERRTFNKIQK